MKVVTDTNKTLPAHSEKECSDVCLSTWAPLTRLHWMGETPGTPRCTGHARLQHRICIKVVSQRLYTLTLSIGWAAISPFRKVAIQINSNASWTRVCHLETNKTLEKEIKREYGLNMYCYTCIIIFIVVFILNILRINTKDDHHHPPCSSSTFYRCFACTHTCDLLSS